MRILFLGDVVGPPGVTLLRRALPLWAAREGADLVVANAENAAGGSGLTAGIYRKLRAAGVELMTLGDHVYKKSEIIPTLQAEDRICRPANLPPEAPGKEFVVANARDGTPVGVFCLLGRTYMRPADCPFHAAERVLAALAGRAKVVVVDAHAEATAEKYLLGHHLKGRVSAVLGTHTHVPTADEQVLAGGTAFICDVGMCGPYDSILGRRVDRVLSTTMSWVPSQFDVATGDARLAGVVVDVDPATGQASAIRRVTLTEAGAAELEASSGTTAGRT